MPHPMDLVNKSNNILARIRKERRAYREQNGRNPTAINLSDSDADDFLLVPMTEFPPDLGFKIMIEGPQALTHIFGMQIIWGQAQMLLHEKPLPERAPPTVKLGPTPRS